MDIYDLSEKSGVSMRTLKKIDRLGALNVRKPKDPIILDMKKNLKKGNRLTAKQQLYLVKNPGCVKSLARWEYELETQIERLGDVMLEAMSWREAQFLTEAATGDKKSIADIAQWIRRFLDANPAFQNDGECEHAYLAVRLLAGVPDQHLELLTKCVLPAMWNCRKSGLIAGYWHNDPKTRRTHYHRLKAYDL